VKWPGKIIEATFLRRYKRFFADFQLADGTHVTGHCANTGSMKTCVHPGAPAWITFHPDPKRKLAYSWQAIQMDDGWVGIHTNLANRLVEEAIATEALVELSGYSEVFREQKYGQNSKIDLLLRHPGRPDCFVEVKNVTLRLQSGVVGFPDAVTTRGQKHLVELMDMAAQGHRAVLVFCVQRESAKEVWPAEAFDPEYAKLLRQAVVAGVEVLAYRAVLDWENISLQVPLPVRL